MQGVNEAITLDMDASKVRAINAILFNQAVTITYLLPIPPIDTASGAYNATYAAGIYINSDNKLIFTFGGAWTGYGAHVTIGYVD